MQVVYGQGYTESVPAELTDFTDFIEIGTSVIQSAHTTSSCLLRKQLG